MLLPSCWVVVDHPRPGAPRTTQDAPDFRTRTLGCGCSNRRRCDGSVAPCSPLRNFHACLSADRSTRLRYGTSLVRQWKRTMAVLAGCARGVSEPSVRGEWRWLIRVVVGTTWHHLLLRAQRALALP